MNVWEHFPCSDCRIDISCGQIVFIGDWDCSEILNLLCLSMKDLGQAMEQHTLETYAWKQLSQTAIHV
jgi:hypothetical protein